MKKFTWLVFSNAVPGHAADFTRWYDGVHLADLLRVPGVVSARRMNLADVQLVTRDDGEMVVCGAEEARAQFQNVAIYEMETDDARTVFDEIIERAGTPDMEISPHLGEVRTILCEQA